MLPIKQNDPRKRPKVVLAKVYRILLEIALDQEYKAANAAQVSEAQTALAANQPAQEEQSV